MGNTQAFSDPIAVGLSADKTIGTEFTDIRRGLGALSNPATGSTAGTRGGVFPGGTTGGGRSTRLQASWNGGMVASINGGHFASDRGAGQHYLGFAYGTITRTLDQGDAQNPRIDYLVIRVRDPGVDSGVTESAKVEILKGTPSASPVEPTSQLAVGDVLLAAVTVPKGATQLSGDAFSDRRRFITSRGGVTPYSPGDLTAGAYEGDPYYNLATKTLEIWDGTSLVPGVSFGPWTEFSPELYYGGDGVSGGASVCALGTNPMKYGKYQLLGKTLKLSCTWKWGTAPYNMGSGPINALLPAGFKSRKTGGDQHFYAYLYTTDQGYMSWPADLGIRQDSNVLTFAAPTSAADGRLLYYKAATSQGQAGTGTPFIANGYPQGGSLSFVAEIEIQ